MKNLMICTNNENMRDYAIGQLPRDLNEDGVLSDTDVVDLADCFIEALIHQLSRDLRIDSVDENKAFRDWNGGQFAHQAEKYGHKRVSGGVVALRADRLTAEQFVEVEAAVADAEAVAHGKVLERAKLFAEDNRRFKAEQAAEDAE